MDLIEINKFPIKDVLGLLLKDKTSGENIIYATDAYINYGRNPKDFIFKEDVRYFSFCEIQPRVKKALDEQVKRTRKKAEVFTPTWLCNMMNNHCDNEWFGRDNVFNHQNSDCIWEENTAHIEFSEPDEWKKYVDSRRLEITCGEAPFVVSRYDTTTGDVLPINRRVGILDRKLRIVNENTVHYDEWYKWSRRAYESVYGYEYQGDNLLIARINLLNTFCDNHKTKWGREPDISKIKQIANIISWNIWQMDGLSDTLPVCNDDDVQITFDKPLNDTLECEAMECRIYDWRAGKSKVFKKIKNVLERGVNMKFDFVIGNPPYQDESNGDKKADPSVYHLFMEEAYKIGNRVELITPARFLFNNGNTPTKWNKSMLADEHFKVLKFESDGSRFFPNNDIKGGVAIHYRDANKIYGAIKQFTAFDELNSILKKVMSKAEISITTIIYNQNKFDLDMLYTDFPDLKNMISSDGKEKRLTSSCINFRCFHEKKESEDDIKILGVSSNKRCYKYINRKYLDLEHENLEKYKVIVPANNGSGAIGEVLSSPLIGSPLIGYTQTFISFGSFDTEQEASNAMQYIKSKFCRVMLGVLKVTQNGKKDTWRYVPLQNFTSDSDIDWSKSIADIDKQLYKKYDLSQDEIDFIESHVKEMD